jgi:hypothetical protein
MPYPRARNLREFTHEELGDELVLFDEHAMKYHTLNGRAARLMALSDGAREVAEISRELYGDASDTHVQYTLYGLDQLAAANLLAMPYRPSRRGMLKLGISIVAGAGIIPVVSSIPVPAEADGLSPLVRPTPVYLREDGQNCTAFDVVSVCKSGCCCYWKFGGYSGVCKPDGGCPGPDYLCG